MITLIIDDAVEKLELLHTVIDAITWYDTIENIYNFTRKEVCTYCMILFFNF